jgi:hypothetical protein
MAIELKPDYRQMQSSLEILRREMSEIQGNAG